jgi:rod shape-determining protein MreC
MDFFLSRYRSLTVLLIVIATQLLLIAYQVKTNKDVPLIRVWAVTTVTPAEQGLELVRRYTWGFVEDYFVLLGVRGENEKLKHENGTLKIENHYLKSELSTADRAQALSVFKAQSPSTTVAARVIGNGTGANSKVVFVDRGSASGVESGMAVVTPDGIVGKVVDAYPTASLVMLMTDPTFAAGVVSQKNRVHGTLKGQGHSECLVDYVQNEEPVDVGEWFYTSGDDRIFPKGFPVGQVRAARNGKTFKEIYVAPSGMQGGVEEVLIVLEGVHQEIPEGVIASPGYKILAPPVVSGSDSPAAAGTSAAQATDADRLRQIYKQAGASQNHVFGEGTPGSKPPDFTKIPNLRGAAPAGNANPPAPAQPGVASNSPAGPAGAAAPKPAAPAVPPPNSAPNKSTTGNSAVSAKSPAPAAPGQGAPASVPKPKPQAGAVIADPGPTDGNPPSETTSAPAPKADRAAPSVPLNAGPSAPRLQTPASQQ